MFAWIARLLGRNKKPLELDIYTNHFTRPNGQWEDPPKVAEVENKLEKMGERLRTEHPATIANARHRHQRVLEQIAAKEKEVRPTATIFPMRTPRMTESPEVKRFRETQAAVDRTRQGMLASAKRSSTFNPAPRSYNPGNPSYNPGNRPNNYYIDEQRQPWMVSSVQDDPPARYAGGLFNSEPAFQTQNNSNYDCPPPSQHSHYDNNSNNHSCPASDPPSYPDPSPSPANND